jgi:hypothetical protein
MCVPVHTRGRANGRILHMQYIGGICVAIMTCAQENSADGALSVSVWECSCVHSLSTCELPIVQTGGIDAPLLFSPARQNQLHSGICVDMR